MATEIFLFDLNFAARKINFYGFGSQSLNGV